MRHWWLDLRGRMSYVPSKEPTRDERDRVTAEPGPSSRYDALEIDGGADTSDGSGGRGTAAPPSPGDDRG